MSAEERQPLTADEIERFRAIQADPLRRTRLSRTGLAEWADGLLATIDAMRVSVPTEPEPPDPEQLHAALRHVGRQYKPSGLYDELMDKAADYYLDTFHAAFASGVPTESGAPDPHPSLENVGWHRAHMAWHAEHDPTEPGAPDPDTCPRCGKHEIHRACGDCGWEWLATESGAPRCVICDAPESDLYHGPEPCILCPHASPHHPFASGVPTEPGAPDPEGSLLPQPCERCGATAYLDADGLCSRCASQPVPAPEPSARLREALERIARGSFRDAGAAMRIARVALAATPQDPEETR